MTNELTTSWAMLVALGAFHGINPGMGWLFAVALGMQERRRGAVIRALLPLGAGHALAVAAALAVALADRRGRSRSAGCGGRSRGAPRLVRRHALRSSQTPALGQHAGGHGRAHAVVIPDGHGARRRSDGGAGLLGMTMAGGGGHAHHMCRAAGAGAALSSRPACTPPGIWPVTALLALLVFEKLGVGLLRRAWLNVDLRVDRAPLVVTGVLTLLM